MDYFEVITNAQTGEQTIRPFTPEEIAAFEAAQGGTSVPSSITPVQLRLTLSIYGLLQAVEAEVAKLGETERIYWQYATAIRRDNPILLGMATKMNLNKEQVDEMFIFAASL